MSLQDAPATDEAARLAEAVRLRRENPELGYIRLGAMVGLHKGKVRRAVEHAATRDEVHSDKPDCAHRSFERHFPDTPKIELNARRERPGWHRWGAEAPDGADKTYSRARDG